MKATMVMLLFAVYGLFYREKPRALRRLYLLALGLLAPHVPLAYAVSGRWGMTALYGVCTALCWTRLHVLPVSRRAAHTARLRQLAGGRRLVLCGLWVWFGNGLLLLLCRGISPGWGGLCPDIAGAAALYDGVWVFAAGALLCLNGMARILLTCRRLNIVRRWLVFATAWVPAIGLLPMLHAVHTARVECDFERYKAHLNEVRAENEVCRTRYPLVLVHGVGFRDLKYFNYWGRIPQELIRNGATVFYGNQEAFATAAYNAHDVKKRILEVLEQTGAGKVNLIAHSKGGLDARYMISQLGMGEYVASLTTVSTPHRGCRFADVLIGRMPDAVYRALSNGVDRVFRAMGDTHPDFHTACIQFTQKYAEVFNRENPDDPRVYYQSYMSVMTNASSHLLLTIPYLMIRALEGENDGLVSVESSKWGEFQGVFRSHRRRGISHGDIIDLKREDYKGFDPMECFVEIVSRLKEKGF